MPYQPVQYFSSSYVSPLPPVYPQSQIVSRIQSAPFIPTPVVEESYSWGWIALLLFFLFLLIVIGCWWYWSCNEETYSKVAVFTSQISVPTVTFCNASLSCSYGYLFSDSWGRVSIRNTPIFWSYNGQALRQYEMPLGYSNTSGGYFTTVGCQSWLYDGFCLYATETYCNDTIYGLKFSSSESYGALVKTSAKNMGKNNPELTQILVNN
jgi:hypothetical protein